MRLLSTGFPIICTVAALAGCGSSTATSDRDQFEALVARGEAISDRYAPPRLVTTPLNMPDTGSATYTGVAAVVVETPATMTVLAGEASIVAEFGTNTLSGSMTNFIGVSGPNVENPPDAVLDGATPYAGTLAVTNGTIGSIVASGVSADFAGSLTGGGNVIVMNGTMIGQFIGNPNPLGLLMQSNDGTSTTTLNGAVVDGTAGLSAETAF